jgi:hypothetical protein
VAAAGGADGAPAPANQRPGGTLVSTVLRMALFWYMMNYFKGNTGAKVENNPDAFFAPLYPKGTPVDMYAYLTENPSVNSIKDSIPIWVEKDLGLATSPDRTYQYTYHPSEVGFATTGQAATMLSTGFDAPVICRLCKTTAPCTSI